ncbi:hypothetical protein CR205_00180 [Alteribacter lacisalsi]|uniref:Uncharacterized protein n=1 Tax=Alteribacter lacisalsi TaxID=2045244 RepID=A0A2W0HJ73_9BACI|nr:hypothetical protein CR205_00180 [Alteribacter lacisalsi]
MALFVNIVALEYSNSGAIGRDSSGKSNSRQRLLREYAARCFEAEGYEAFLAEEDAEVLLRGG